MENREELTLVIGEDGKARLYEEPYATIEVKTEEDYNFLVNAIDKQTAVKPIANHYEEEGEKEYIKHKCPSCDSRTIIIKEIDKFCHNCGKKIDWN